MVTGAMKKSRVGDMEREGCDFRQVVTEGLAEEVLGWRGPSQGTSKCKGPEVAHAQHTCHLHEGRDCIFLSS